MRWEPFPGGAWPTGRPPMRRPRSGRLGLWKLISTSFYLLVTPAGRPEIGDRSALGRAIDAVAQRVALSLGSSFPDAPDIEGAGVDAILRAVEERFRRPDFAKGGSRVVTEADIGEALEREVVERGARLEALSLAGLRERLRAELLGLGPLEPVMADPEVTDVPVNGPAHVFVERSGRLERASVQFQSEAHLRR